MHTHLCIVEAFRNMPCAGVQDQVANMRAKGVAAAQLCSTLTAAERKATLAALEANQLRLLYVTPELLVAGWWVQPCMPVLLLLHTSGGNAHD